MSKTIKRLFLPLVAVAALLLLVLTMAGYFRDKIEPGLDDHGAIDSSSAVAVVRLKGASTEPVSASVEAREATIVSSRLLARINSIEVRAGDYVAAGQLLLTLESDDLQSRVRQAKEQIKAVQARLTEAAHSLARAQELYRKSLIAVADLDAAQANASSLEADLAASRQAMGEAETALNYAEIRSPIAGRVVDRFAEPGDTTSPGAPLMSLYNPVSLWVEAQVREQLALSLALGDELRVEIPSLDKVLTGRIEEIVPAADTGSRSFLIKAILPSDQGLLPGIYARVQVPAGERNRLLIPADRVAQIGQLNVVWVVESGAAVRRFVRLGRSAGEGLIEVVAGLEEGDKILPVP